MGLRQGLIWFSYYGAELVSSCLLTTVPLRFRQKGRKGRSSAGRPRVWGGRGTAGVGAERLRAGAPREPLLRPFPPLGPWHTLSSPGLPQASSAPFPEELGWGTWQVNKSRLRCLVGRSGGPRALRADGGCSRRSRPPTAAPQVSSEQQQSSRPPGCCAQGAGWDTACESRAKSTIVLTVVNDQVHKCLRSFLFPELQLQTRHCASTKSRRTSVRARLPASAWVRSTFYMSP